MVTHRKNRASFLNWAVRLVLATLVVAQGAQSLQAQRSAIASRVINAPQGSDAGQLPVSQPMRLTLRLKPTAEREAALEEFLANQTTPGSLAYHRWLTPQQFAENYGATDEQIGATTSWLAAQGLTVSAVSAARTRMVVSGTVDQVQRAFAVSMRSYVVGGSQRFASTSQPSVPMAIAANAAGVSGLDDMPAVAKTNVTATSATGVTTLIAGDPLDALGAVVDANAAPILALTMSDCTGTQGVAEYEAYRALFRQASAQGITVVTSSSCGLTAAAQAGNLTETTALATAPVAAVTAADGRPAWQVAPGLPSDALRHSPDLVASSVEDFAKALVAINQESGGRQGNINARLYAMASTPDLYSQPDGASGTWESATGLGTVNLRTLVRAYPRATQATTMTLTSNTTSTLAGTSVILTATVYATASGATIVPTGTVAFYDTFNGSTVQLGSVVAVSPNGQGQSVAVYQTTGLPGGAHSIYAAYISSDSNFSNSASPSLAIAIKDFTITKVPQTLTLKAGTSGKATLLLAMVGGFNGTVTFGCTPPANTETTCTFSPMQLNGGGSTTLTITTTAASTTTADVKPMTWNLLGGTALATLLWFAVPRRRSGLVKLLVVLGAVAMTANLGCGTGKTTTTTGNTVTDPGTPLGTLTFSITSAGSDGTNVVRHTDQYQVTIQ